jgi:hypothetical protein
MTYTSLVVAFLALTVLTMGLALYRKLLSMHEDDYIHLGPGQERLLPQQNTMAHRMHSIDVWGEVLTAVTLFVGLVLGALYLYHGWIGY